MNISKTIFAFSLLLLSFLLNACSGLTISDQPANTTWWLKPYAGAMQASPHEVPRMIAVSVTAVPGLDTNRILTLSDDAELNSYASARWADNLPELVESLVGRTLESSGRFEVASGRIQPDSDDCDLQLEVREFFAGLDGDGKTDRVRVAIFGRYQCGSAEAVPIQLGASVPVLDERMSVIVGAFQQAVDSVLTEMLKKLIL